MATSGITTGIKTIFTDRQGCTNGSKGETLSGIKETSDHKKNSPLHPE
jgi:hypothetical protein